MNMLSVTSYSHLLTAFFAYSAIGLVLLTVIFAIITGIVSSQRISLLLVTLLILTDAIFASIASYFFSNMTESPVEIHDKSFMSYGLISGGTLALYVSIRISYTFSDNIKPHLWNNGSIFMRLCFVVQLLFSGILTVLLLLHLLMITFWAIQGFIKLLESIVSLLWNVIIWPIKYVMIKRNQTLVK